MLFFGLIVASNPAWTGLGLHEWLAGILIVPVIYHLAINWDWVGRTAINIAEKLKTVSAANFVVDVALFVAIITVMLSGFMVLPGVASQDYDSVISLVWRQVHSVSSDMTVITMVLHLLLHMPWMYRTAARSILPQSGRHAIGRARAASDRRRGGR